MRFFGMIFFLLSTPLFASHELTTRVHDIDYGVKPGDEVLVLLESGDVAKLRTSNEFLRTKEDHKKIKKQWYSIILDDERYIVQMVPTKGPVSNIQSISQDLKTTEEFLPTTIASMDVAKQYFREARYNPKESQCFNRAMVWSYEWWKKHSLKSKKMFIYFTREYIRRYNFEWWFHVAPLVHIMDEGKVVERMMDIKYSRGPLEIRKWSDLFMKNNAPCNVITKYSEYADYPYTGDCYIQRANMYNYQPADPQMNEAWGYTKDKFIMTEVRAAYLEAYDEQI